MTAQIPETLRIEGREHAMCTEPLESWFAVLGKRPDFAELCTGLWRGYEALWEIVDRRLYLLALEGQTWERERIDLPRLFPGYGERVFAHWYTGTLRLPEGRLLAYEHGGYASTYARDRLLRIERGVLVREELRRNGDDAGSEDGDADEHDYVVAAVTYLPPLARDDEAG